MLVGFVACLTMQFKMTTHRLKVNIIATAYELKMQDATKLTLNSARVQLTSQTIFKCHGR
jgi:hypothetical protein